MDSWGHVGGQDGSKTRDRAAKMSQYSQVPRYSAMAQVWGEGWGKGWIGPVGVPVCRAAEVAGDAPVTRVVGAAEFIVAAVVEDTDPYRVVLVCPLSHHRGPSS